MSRIADLVARQKAKLEDAPEHTYPVVVDGETLTLGFRKVSPQAWDDLIGRCPARPGRDGDAQVGYNPKALSRSYPNVTVDGEDVEPGEWADLFDVLDPVFQNNIEVTLWGININETLKAIREVGKARAGQK